MTRHIGLALSGGGSRAAAFHLGCLRALNDRDLLSQIRVVSGISGGSLLAALWAYGPTDFADFDAHTTELLRAGLQKDIIRKAFTPAAATRNLTAASQAAARGLFSRTVTVARPVNRTDALATLLTERAFGTKTMDQVTHPGLDTVLTATDLATTNAVRFGSTLSSCSRYGTITEPVQVATAVAASAASAAFPVLLPALERTFTFERSGQRQRQTVLLTDGGVFDNLGLSVLEPGRNPAFTPQVFDVSYIIACDAGPGELPSRAPHFFAGRLRRSFEVVHRKNQDAGRARLHEWGAAGRIDGFTLAYLGMQDHRLPAPPADLVPRERVASYPTNFAAMNRADFTAVTTRGEQLTRALLPLYLS